MKASLIILNTMTQCIKAQKYLIGLGIKASVERITGINTKTGCGYGVRVYENPDKVCRLLVNIGINCTEIFN